MITCLNRLISISAFLGAFITFALGQTGVGSARIQLTNIASIPETLVDSTSYQLQFHVVNVDPSLPINANQAIFLLMSVNGDAATVLASAIPSSPVAPGDSLLVSATDYVFSSNRFAGGGITHDIIVWPMTVGDQGQDSVFKDVQYVNTLGNHSREMGFTLGDTDFPTLISEPVKYDLDFYVHNNDPTRLLYHPITIFISIDGGVPWALVEHVTPPTPMAQGDSLLVRLEQFQFDKAYFGGGITHDIIVWPMTVGPMYPDSLEFENISFIAAGLMQDEVNRTNGPISSPILVSAHPNPFEENLELILEMPESAEASLTILDLRGKTILRQRLITKPGQNRENIDLSEYPDGIYLYQVLAGGQMQAGRVFKISK